MGNSCSSGQAHKDKDNMSQRSEESGSYHVRTSLPSEKQQILLNHVSQQQQQHHHSGVLLEPITAGQASLQTCPPVSAAAAGAAVSSAPTAGEQQKKPVLSKVLRGVATSSISDSMSLSSPPGVHSPKGFEHSHVPKEVCSLSEPLQSLIMGRISEAKTETRTRKIVVYVCAADSQDCCVEKGALHNTVYPELRAHCRAKGYELHIVDLHWRTPLEKQQDHEFPELCIGELTRQMEVAYVIPVIFLNNSLGTPLLPITIESADFKMALDSAENRSAQNLLSKWYQVDGAAQPPCYRLQPISSHIPGFKETSAEDRARALEEWSSEIDRMLEVLVNIFPQELRDTYLTTVVEQEVHNTVFMSQELAKRCVWLNRVYVPATRTPDGASPGESELHRRLNNLQRDLRSQLAEKHIVRLSVRHAEGGGPGLDPALPEHKQYMEQVVGHLRKHLAESIDAIVDEHQTKTLLRPSYGIDGALFEELNQQTGFCQRAARCSVNRERALDAIRGYVTGDAAVPLVVHGAGGCGKSTLLARVAQLCQAWSPEALLVLRFVAISAQSATTEQLLASVVDQCSILTYGHKCYCAHSVDAYARALPPLLAAVRLQRPLVILIDGMDQVKAYGSRSVDWVPVRLPDNVKVILSVTEESDTFRRVRARLEGAAFVKMSSLEENEARGILMSSVMQYNHSVNSRIQDCVLRSVQECTLPLYAKVLAWQTSWWADKEHDIVPKGNVGDQLGQMLEELEQILGAVQVQHALSIMTNTKHGITDSEMIDLLAFDEHFRSAGTYVAWAPACLAWSRLNKHLAPFLRWTLTGGALGLQWRDEVLLRAVRARYKEHTRWANRMLRDYYMGKWWTEKPKNLAARLVSQDTLLGKCYNRRKLDELPFQSQRVDPPAASQTSPYLTDLDWIYEKVCGSDCFQLLEDIRLSGQGEQRNALVRLLEGFLEAAACVLNYDGRQFYAHLYGYLSKCPPQTDPDVLRALAVAGDPPVPSLIPLREAAAPHPSHRDKFFDMVTRLPGSEQFVVAVSTNEDEICVWDVKRCRRARTLKGVTHPINLIPIDRLKCVVLCRRELKTYDLDSGTFVNKLKGVMNQKMPYYGLHDQAHLVALSRNRMYVNLMNLETGDCVTTFKAGEDRFLNSLLVSGDGRILVCGDETQKPFPLLVWNLGSKKLLYDLRIPHHDFITSLSAITFEGSYVCCVCHEIDEPNPNFIVVYDLQSGTLFKKWKPSCNTVALEISSQGGCVISGLEDARILVWDLITGNCRWSLCGHTAPVSCLRLDPTGALCLSSDVQGRDRSIRVWDLNKGNLVSVYTPDCGMTASEIMPGGKHIVLALEGNRDLITLELRGPDVEPTNADEVYGVAENDGKTFELKENDTC